MTGPVWVASYALLWVAVVVLGFAVVVLLRQIGVLHARLRPMGVHPAGEGPEVGSLAPPAPGVAYEAAPLTLVAFTSPTCTVCAGLVPSLRALARSDAELVVQLVDHGPQTAATFRAFGVASTPYVVAVDGRGVVRGAGVANTLEQVEVLVDDARAQASGQGR